ncbi:protein transport protein sec31 [Lactuca sativa]|uniref:Uncharacterized protein n=1 Tax=Lactuca sativa TaxID=4236 RepID=A0A9R1VAR8_LACSA|nr:protein transport protein sec31 [Lactuca sativa]KAJ0201398.1 hypothetical protein LSAT_V11C600330400 [Lactuca sativa]
MAIITKFHHFFSLFYKQRKLPPKSQPQKVPSPYSPPPSTPPPINRDMGAAQAMKRIPRIKFPQRHPAPSGSATQTQATPVANDVPSSFFSKSAPSEKTLGGKASLQPKRTPMSQEEIDAIMLGGCL